MNSELKGSVNTLEISKTAKQAIDAFGLKILDFWRVPESYSSEVWRLKLETGNEVILKIPYSDVKFHREQFFLKRLRGIIPVPIILDTWNEKDTSPPALLLSCLPGSPATELITNDTASQMGELLGRLHQIPAECYGQLETQDSSNIKLSWETFLRKRYEQFRDDCRSELSRDVINRCNELFETFMENLPQAGGPCIVHMDFRPGNILINKKHEITGLIDFESSRGGSPEIDFIKVVTEIWKPCPNTHKSFLDGYSGVCPLPNLDRTLPLHLFCNALGGISWCIRRNQLGSEFHRQHLTWLDDFLQQSFISNYISFFHH
jgi:Ser/Thr protein kinase RdoA (MazF antagonist)